MTWKDILKIEPSFELERKKFNSELSKYKTYDERRFTLTKEEVKKLSEDPKSMGFGLWGEGTRFEYPEGLIKKIDFRNGIIHFFIENLNNKEESNYLDVGVTYSFPSLYWEDASEVPIDKFLKIYDDKDTIILDMKAFKSLSDEDFSRLMKKPPTTTMVSGDPYF
tara:strand:- start:23 stop:517 length:495 start_codon:yes stop_codon:yes gene_type:complete